MNAFIERFALALLPDFLKWLRDEYPYIDVGFMSDDDVVEYCVSYLAFVEERALTERVV